MTKVFITGEIGSGKSYVTKRLAGYSGWPVLNVDAVVKSLYQDEVFCTLLKDLFNTCDKAEVSALVFSDTNKLDVLEAATANVIKEHIEAALRQHNNLLIEFPLLFEYPEYLDVADVVVYVTADETVRWDRVSKRDGRSRENFDAINAKQLRISPESKRARASATVVNDGTVNLTDAWCANFFNRYIVKDWTKYAK